MAKISGLGMTALSVDNASGTLVDIRNDVTNCDWDFPIALQDITGVDKYAMERQALLRDFTISLNGIVNPSTSHTVFSTITASSSPAREILLTVGGMSLGATPAFTVLFTGYAMSRSNTGELTFSTSGSLASGDIPAWT